MVVWLRALVVLLFLPSISTIAQLPNPALVGYWHNWNDGSAPYIPLTSVDPLYNVIAVTFATPVSPSDMRMQFVPDGLTAAAFMRQMQTLQAAGRKILLSVGGVAASIDLSTAAARDTFATSLTGLLLSYGFDGLDIDIESGASVLNTSGTIQAPGNVAQQNLISAIQQIMSAYQVAKSKKLLLTMAPETAYVQGGKSAFGGVWGGYLPIIDALRNDLDLVHVQLYNSGTMYGNDGAVYTQGTADFIVAMTEALIQGFSTAGGAFTGLPASKVAVGLPACGNAAPAGGYVSPADVTSAVNYLRGTGPKPGAYMLQNSGAHPTLRTMMTWSVNWDATATCQSSYEYARTFSTVFGNATAIGGVVEPPRNGIRLVPNPTTAYVHVQDGAVGATLRVLAMDGRCVEQRTLSSGNEWLNITALPAGVYRAEVLKSGHMLGHQKLVVR